MKMKYDFNKIVSQFKVKGSLVSCEPYGEGHINETYLATLDDNGKTVRYIVQKINTGLFKDVDKLMSNIVSVTNFARERIIAKFGDPDRESLTVVFTKGGKPYYYDEASKGTFRVYIFITDAVAYQIVEKPEHFYQSALAFGNFANLLADFDASKLYEILPDFHNTEKRFNDFLTSVKNDKFGRAKDVKKEIDFFLERKDYAGRIVSLLRSGEMPLKVTHNDTKLNNVLIDALSGKYVAVIDLDTIMPGSICYDFGDSIRFGCNTAAEDEKNLSKVNFDINLFKTYANGYLEALGDSITKIEKDNLAFGAILMTFECGMRFLADYLDGDVYFRTHREGHNLDRARTQIKLVSDMEARFDEMKEIVKKY
ncbi:MAG: aminoglycoside phosphotransferase family protein [Clostridia bacterium]|nr:aminoglycoside phosphotransferase family protein [Clostridia bacterium]